MRRSASRVSIGLAVAGLHLLGVLLWWTADRGMQWVRSAPLRSASIAVWLPALTTPETPAKPSRPPKPAEPTQKSPQPPARVGNPPRDAQAMAAPPDAPAISTPTAAESQGVVAVPTPTPTPMPTPTAPALNLGLSRKAIASVAPPSFAEQSAFHGRMPATVERQIANATAATGPWTEERIDNDHIRFRRGNTCINLQRPRAASIDPFSESAARLPWRTSGAEECQ